ncbi:hypothetical protein [Polycladidibacter stylochi]|uniref:hypothetical protein n=1 Tax=Polycladidibacter stylochi TaxID=1807766 RepID=UPI000AC763ED|nr:hypothetical protein [Pseudovibrio stylochi]
MKGVKMKVIHKVTLGVGSLLIVGVIALSMSDSSSAEQLFDGNTIKSIELGGDSTALSISTHKEAKEIRIEAHDKRWCSIEAHANVKGDVLHLTIERPSVSGWLLCDPVVALELPEERNLKIKLDALAADINGRFAAVSLTGDKNVLNFEGKASAFKLDGDAGVFNVRFTEPIAREAVRIDVPLAVSRVIYAD